MDPVSAPDSVDVQDFQFKLHRRIRIFDSKTNVQSEPLDLIITASTLGLLFIGSPDKTLRILQLKDVVEGSDTICSQRVIHLSSAPINVSLNCDFTLLSVVVNLNNAPFVIVYNTKSLITEKPIIHCEIRLSTTPNVQLCRLLWNPCQPDSLAACMSDGSLSVFICKPSSVELQTKATKARCLSWSPKGKQIVTGDSDGTLNQYKPDLTLVKTIPAAKFFNEGKTSALAIHWISNYQFCVVFEDSSNPDNRPCVAIVNTPKNGPISYINYDDICYSMGDYRKNQYFILHLPLWGVILASSANSMELGVLGTTDQNNWIQWTQIDEARAELPLTEDKQESYPIGVSLDNSALVQLPWGDGQTLPHMPMLHVLTHSGMLVSYYVINIIKNMPNMCIVPEILSIPVNLLTTKFFQNEDKQKTPPISASTNFQDNSFNVPSNTITSTPTLPKPALSGPVKPISTNLFGKINEIPVQKNNTVEPNHKPLQFQLPKKDNATLFSETKHEKTEFQEIQNKLSSQLTKQEPVLPNNLKSENSGSGIQSKSFQSIIKSVPSEVIKSMLLSEVNGFQKDLFELLQKCKHVDIEIGNSDEMNEISTVLSSKDQKLTKCNWSDEDIKKEMIILKHNLINTCAFLAEARMQPASLELEQLAQLDPVSSSKMNSIKLTMYYIESQLRQVNNVLDEQWEIFQDDCRKKSLALSGSKDNDYMKMPTLEKIYQPLLKQSEILVKQQSIIGSLQKTIDSMDLSSISKNSRKNASSIIMKGDDYKNKTIAMLTSEMNNINLLSTNQKISKPNPSKAKHDSLRKILLNHNTTKIKSVKIEPPSMLQSFHEWNSVNKIDTKLPNHKDTPSNFSSSDNMKTPSKALENTKASISIQTNVTFSNHTQDKPVLNAEEITSKTTKQNNINLKTVEPSKPTAFESKSEASLQKPSTASIFQNIFGKSPLGEEKGTLSNKFGFSNSFSPSNTDPTVVSPIFKTSTIPSTSSSFKSFTSISATGSTPESAVKPETKEIPSNISLFKDIPKQVEGSTKAPVSTLAFGTSTSSAPVQLKNFSFSFAPAISSAFSTTNSSLLFNSSPPTTQIVSINETKTNLFQSSSINTTTTTIPSSTAVSFSTITSAVSSNNVISSNTIFPSVKITTNVVSSISPAQSFNTIAKVTPSNPNINLQPPISSAVVVQKNDNTNLTIISATSSLQKLTNLDIIPPNVSITPNKPLSENLIKTSDQSAIKKVDPINTPIPITSETVAIPIEKTGISFGSKIPDSVSPPVISANTFIPTTTVSFTPTTSNTFPTTPTSSLLITPTQTCTTTKASLFISPQQTTTSFPTLNLSTGPIFGSSTSSTSANQDIFKSPIAVNTCASSLFGAASAAIDTSVESLFGNTSISATSTQSPFSNTNPTNPVFGGGPSIFGSQTTFSTTSNSIFGGASSSFAQPQTNVFGGSTTFGGFGTPSQSTNLFGQAVQSTNNSFGISNNTNQSSVFGSNAVANNAFGSPAPTPQQSVFGSPSTQGASVFGGSPSFGSKPTFGQSPSFGSSPQGAFGIFGSNDQVSVAQSGFGTPGGFNKPSGGFGGSPKFGGSPSFGAAPAFGASPAFGGSANNSFGSSPGFTTGTQQSSTFESLATQSTLSFGNLAQQTQQAPQSQPLFQGSSSFSTWR